MALEDLEKNLYKKIDSAGPKKKTPPLVKPAPTNQVPESKVGWLEENSTKEKQTSGFLSRFSKISHLSFWILAGIAVIIVGSAAYYFYHYQGSNNVVFSLNAPSDNMLAVPFDLQFDINNSSNSILKDVKLSMILPKGTAFAGEDQEKRAIDKSLGDINQNIDLKDKIPMIIFSGSQSVEQFQVKISYYTPALGSAVRFEDAKSISVNVKDPALKLDLIAPQKVLNNEDFELEVHYENISNIDFSNVELNLIYPQFFTFEKASVNPSKGNNIWNLGDLIKNNGQKTFTITGKVLISNQSFFDIRGSLNAEVLGQKYLISEKTASLNITSSPLLISISVNGQPNYLASLNSNLNYQFSYRNNSDVGLNDVVVIAKLIGDMFNFSTYRGDGYFDSNNNTITWNAANTPALAVVSPGANNSVGFTIQTKENYPIKRVSDQNFVLEAQAEISSPTVPYYVASDKTIGLADLKTKVNGKVVIVSEALFNDSASGITNQGSLPPKVNVPTDFTIHWIITNYSTDVSGIQVSASLMSGVRWTGQVKSNIDALPTYNERTGQISWSIDKIPATKGVVSPPVEAIFQIEATPNITQANQPMPLISATNLTATDGFTNIQLTSQAKDVNTQLTNDPTVGPNKGTVVP